MPHAESRAACLVSVAAMVAATPALAAPFFDRVASFPVARNLPEGTDPATPTSAEIVSASGDGMTLVYSDSPNQAIGFIDITDPAAPGAARQPRLRRRADRRRHPRRDGLRRRQHHA